MLLRFPLRTPLAYQPHDPWLHDGLRTLAEALTLAASRYLDIDPVELNANYCLVGSIIRGAMRLRFCNTAQGSTTALLRANVHSHCTHCHLPKEK